MKAALCQRGFTLAEVLIAMVGSVIVIGALLVGSMGLQRSFQASETYANSQAAGRRLIDYVARDIRRAIGLAASGAGGAPVKLSGATVRLETDSTLIVTLPAYYKSNAADHPDYDQPLSLIASGDRVAYGTAAGPAAEFPVFFRKLFIAGEKSVCFVRDEGGARQVIARGAEDLQLQVTLSADGEACALAAQFLSPYGRARPVVAVYDQVMLRNVRVD